MALRKEKSPGERFTMVISDDPAAEARWRPFLTRWQRDFGPAMLTDPVGGAVKFGEERLLIIDVAEPLPVASSLGGFSGARRLQFVRSSLDALCKVKAVNEIVSPHAVIFAERDWKPGSFVSLHAHRFAHLPQFDLAADESFAEVIAAATDNRRHYAHAPELDLHGKWPVVVRRYGLEPLLMRASGCRVLDLGAAEGGIALDFLRHGAAAVHGFEREPSRVDAARALCSRYERAMFDVADLSNWEAFCCDTPHLQPSYEIVLYLGLHHHLPAPTRVATLLGAQARATHFLAVRTPAAVFDADGIGGILRARDWVVLSEEQEQSGTGRLIIYRRAKA